MIRKLMFALLAVVVLGPTVSAAPIYSMSNTTGLTLGNPPFSLGSQFTVSTEMTLTALGIFDSSQDGLAESHEVGLFAADGSLIVSTTIGAGIANPLTDQFRYASVAPVTLEAGATYRIAALYLTGSDALLFPGTVTDFSTASGITFDGSRFIAGSTLQDPGLTIGGLDPAYFGPNAIVSPVPVPAGAVLFGLGMASLGGARLIRRRKIVA